MWKIGVYGVLIITYKLYLIITLLVVLKINFYTIVILCMLKKNDIGIYFQSLMAKSCFTVWHTRLSVA